MYGSPVMVGALGLALLLGCAAPQPTGPRGEPPGARRLLAALERALQQRSPDELYRLFTPECRSGGCRGIAPHPVGAEGRRIRARWMARVDDGDLLEDLARAVLSYGKIGSARLTPQQWRSFHGVALLRAELSLRGVDRGQRLLEDRGLVDLTLRHTAAGWRIDRLVFARVERTLELRPEDLQGVEGSPPPAARMITPPPASRPEADPADEQPQPEPDGAEPERSGPGLLPSNLLELTVKGGGREVPLRGLAGGKATLLLVWTPPCPGCPETCRGVAALLERRPGCKGAQLVLGGAPGLAVHCGLPERRPGRQMGTALARVKSLLPLTVVLDAEGRVQRMISGEGGEVELEAEIGRRCQ